MPKRVGIIQSELNNPRRVSLQPMPGNQSGQDRKTTVDADICWKGVPGMAKAKAETSLMGEMFQVRLFKPNQGRVVRQVTALAVFAIFAASAYRLYATILIDVGRTLVLRFPGSSSGVAVPGSLVQMGLPALVVILGAWASFRLVNWPPFANFLISVEAEMDKVSWASLDYLKRATAVVLVMMVFLGAYLFLCDVFWQQLFMLIGFLDSSAPPS